MFFHHIASLKSLGLSTFKFLCVFLFVRLFSFIFVLPHYYVVNKVPYCTVYNISETVQIVFHFDFSEEY